MMLRRMQKIKNNECCTNYGHAQTHGKVRNFGTIDNFARHQRHCENKDAKSYEDGSKRADSGHFISWQ